MESAENTVLMNAFLDAAAKEFAAELSEAEPVAVSSHFQRQMKAMLQNPKGWAKRRCRPIWKKVLQTAAAIILVCAVSLGALMAVSPTARAAVLHWVMELYETHIVYRYSGESASTKMPRYEITDLPEGYKDNGKKLELPDDLEIRYENDNDKDKVIRFEYMKMQQGSALIVDTEQMTVSDVEVNGCPGQLYISRDPKQSSAIVWSDESNRLQFLIDGFVDMKELMHMARSVSLYHLTK